MMELVSYKRRRILEDSLSLSLWHLILDYQASTTVRNKYQLYKNPVCDILLQQPTRLRYEKYHVF